MDKIKSWTVVAHYETKKNTMHYGHRDIEVILVSGIKLRLEFPKLSTDVQINVGHRHGLISDYVIKETKKQCKILKIKEILSDVI